MRTKGTAVEIVAEEIIIWMEENPVPATMQEISQSMEANYVTVTRAVRLLEERGHVVNPTPLVTRNAKYRLSNEKGERSKMPHFKGDDGRSYPISEVYKVLRNTSKNPERAAKWHSKPPRNKAAVGILLLFAAAYQSSQAEYTLARQYFTLARQNLVKARTQAARDLAFIDSILADERLNPQKIASLIPILLEDQKYPIDLYQIMDTMESVNQMIEQDSDA